MIRADTTRTCAGCPEIRDEPWAGERETAHRCMAAGPQQGRAVGFDRAWNNLIPAWCPRRFRRESGKDGKNDRYGLPEGTPMGLQEPPKYESRGEIHPGAMDAPMEKTKSAAGQRWRAMREQLEAQKLK